ncbi:ABC transporter permease [Microbacterium trichothecenolyticum]|uniref:ABC transporter permease n=1 Tax=Microbacterium trichothecenolyticum TaxID=69370 RepID=UPI001C6E9514|nr:ABC transporter permease [Microbacterium trichothecenolyticum]MBW9121904.1 ABC transporter permease [Microbacterium trichothecenolyticum]
MSDLLTVAEIPALGTDAEDAVVTAPADRSRRVSVRIAPGVIVSVVVIALALGFAFFPQFFTSQSPIDGIPRDTLQPPSAAHWFGTDQLGRDVYSRVVYGAALSLQASAIAVGLGLIVGSLLGLVAGFAGGRTDGILMRVVDVLLAVPGLLLSLTVVVALGFGTLNVAIAVGIGSIASFARLMRAEVLRIRRSDYIEASIALGRRWPGVIGEHVLPNASGPVLALATLEFGMAILAVSALSFLGFGAEPPAPEWGALIAEGRNFLATSWWLTTLPGLVVVAVVLATNRIGRALEHDLGADR